MSEKTSTTTEEKPILTALSWEQVKFMDKLQRRMQRSQKRLAGDLDDDEYMAAELEVDKLYEEIQAMIAKAVVSIPRLWLVAEAPAQLNWDDPKTLGWLQGPNMSKLVKLVTGAAADEEAKN